MVESGDRDSEGKRFINLCLNSKTNWRQEILLPDDYSISLTFNSNGQFKGKNIVFYKDGEEIDRL